MKITCVYNAGLTAYSSSINHTNLQYTGDVKTGYKTPPADERWGIMVYGSTYYCTKLDFSSVPTSGDYTLEQIKNYISKRQATITKITLTMNAKTYNNDRHINCYYGPCCDEHTTLSSDKSASWGDVTTSSYVATITKDVTSWGFPEYYSYAAGGTNNSYTNAYGWLTGATLTVEFDLVLNIIHIKKGSNILDGFVYYKKNNTMYIGTVYYKNGDEIYLSQ